MSPNEAPENRSPWGRHLQREAEKSGRNPDKTAPGSVPPESEFLSREGYCLHVAEKRAHADARTRFRRFAWLSLALIALFTLVATCTAAEPIMLDRTAEPQWAYFEAEDIARQWPGSRIIVPTGTSSMWPTLHEGCYVVIAPKPWAEVCADWRGEILSFATDKREGTRTLHRAVGSYGDKLLTQGDNNSQVDRGYVSARNYRGAVVAIVKFKDVPYRDPMSYAAWAALQRRESRRRREEHASAN